MQTLIETAPGTITPAAGGVALVDLISPAASREWFLSAESYTENPADPGWVSVFKDLDDPATTYPLLAGHSFAPTVDGDRVYTTADLPFSAGRRGHVLPVASIQNKAAITFFAIARWSADNSSGSKTQTIIGSGVTRSPVSNLPMLRLARASNSNLLQLAARHDDVSEGAYTLSLPAAPPADEFVMMIAQVDYYGGEIYLSMWSETLGLQEARAPAFTGLTGANSGSPTGQGFGLGAPIGNADANTWDNLKFKGEFYAAGLNSEKLDADELRRLNAWGAGVCRWLNG